MISLSSTVTHHCVYLCNKLDDFDKDIERHVSWYHTARSFGEKRCYNGVEATADTEKGSHYEETFDEHLKTFLSLCKITWKNIKLFCAVVPLLERRFIFEGKFILGVINLFKMSDLARWGFLMWAQAHNNICKLLINLWSTSTDNLV